MFLKTDESVMLDRAIEEIGETIHGIEWVDSWMGRSERRVQDKGGTRILSKPYYDNMIPMAYSGEKNKFYPLFPCTTYGNFGYFDVDDKYKLSHQSSSQVYKASIKGNIVVWWDYRTVFGAENYKSFGVSRVESMITDELLSKNWSSLDDFTLRNTNLRVQEIYDDYNHKEVESQFAMRPYGLIAITVNFMIDSNLC